MTLTAVSIDDMTTPIRHRAALLLAPVVLALLLPIVRLDVPAYRFGATAPSEGGGSLAFDPVNRASLTPSAALLALRRAFDHAQSPTSFGHLSSLAVHLVLLLTAAAVSPGWLPRWATLRARYANRDPPVLQPT